MAPSLKTLEADKAHRFNYGISITPLNLKAFLNNKEYGEPLWIIAENAADLTVQRPPNISDAEWQQGKPKIKRYRNFA